MSSKYGGYKTHAVRESLLTWAPHIPSRAQQESKYESNYISEIPDAASLSTSMSIRATMGMKAAEYHAPTKSNEVAVLPIQKPCATKSSMASTFIDFRDEISKLRSVLEQHDISSSSNNSSLSSSSPSTLSSSTPSAGAIESHLLKAWSRVDTANAGAIVAKEIRMALRELFGGHEGASLWQLKTIEAMAAPALRANGGRISLEQWVQALRAALVQMEDEVTALTPANQRKSVAVPTRYKEAQDAARRAGATAVSLGLVNTTTTGEPAARTAHVPIAAVGGLKLHGAAALTSYGIDIGIGETGGPTSRPVHDIGSGFFSTTHDIASGTSVASKHPPGYAGHIPTLVGSHPPLHGHGLGFTVRDTFNSKTNVAETFQRRVPGYSGHVPKFSSSSAVDVDIPGGQFAPTLTKARDSLIEQYWASKK